MAIKKEIIGANGEKKEYFKIKRIVLDYETHHFVVECQVYTDSSYRDEAREKIQAIELDEALWNYLQNKEDKTIDELTVLAKIDYGKVIKAHKEAAQLVLKDEQIAIDVENTDVRNIFYELLKNTSQLEGATDVLETNPVITIADVVEELNKRTAIEEEKRIELQNSLEVPERDPNGGL